MFPLALDPAVPDFVGRFPVPLDDFEAKLGRPAFHVWQVLCARRDAQAITHVTRKGIARARGFVAIAEALVKDALVRLTHAGLVETLGWRKLLVRRGEKQVEREVFMRRVMGVRATGRTVLVPGSTWRWLQMAPTHGGARRGAGRPQEVEDPDNRRLGDLLRKLVSGAYRHHQRTGVYLVDHKHGLDLEAILKHLGACPGSRHAWHIDHIRPLASFNLRDPEQFRIAGAPTNHQWLPATVNLHKSSKWTNLKSPQPSGVGQTSRPPTEEDLDQDQDQRSSLSLRERDTPADRGSSSLPTAGGGHANVVRGDLGQQFGGSSSDGGRWPGVPSYPGWSIVAPATIPSPPALDADASEQRKVDILLRAFRGAVESRYKTRCTVLLRGVPKGSKYWKALLGAAAAMIEHDVAPAAWAAFSIDGWRRVKPDGDPPAITWVMSAKRVVQWHGWFHSEENSYGGGLAVFTPTHQRLLRLYAAMSSDLRRSNPVDEGAVYEIVERYFPGGMYSRLVVKARAEAIEKQGQLSKAAERGEWLW